MPAPPPYVRDFSFAGFQSNNPNRPLPGAALDNELENIEQSLDQTIAGLNDIRRPDGALRNGIVGRDALAPDLATGVRPATLWQAGIQYAAQDTVSFGAAFYRCTISHTSAPSFSTDLTAGRWVVYADIGPVATAAETARNEAVAAVTAATTQAGAAAASATAADVSADAAATSATAADASADAAAASATAAAGSASAAAGSATAAATSATAAAASAASIDPTTLVTRTGATGAANLPAGTTAQRPASPVAGQARFNSQTGLFEAYDGTAWGPLGGGGGSVPDGSLTAAAFPAANDTVALPAIRRRLRNLPDLLDYGTYSDMSAAMNAAAAASATEGFNVVLVPRGVWAQNTAPANITRGLLFEGEDRSSTLVNVNHAGSAFGFTGQNGGGGGVTNMFISASGANSPFAAVRADAAAAGFSPDGLVISNLWITYTSTGRWGYGIWLDGAARNPGSGLQGLRDFHVQRIITFGTVNNAIFARNCRGAYFSDLLLNGVGGVNTFALLGNSATNSERNDGICFSNIVCGQLIINNTNALNGTITCQGGFNTGGTITNSKVVVPNGFWSAGPSVPPGSVSGLGVI